MSTTEAFDNRYREAWSNFATGVWIISTYEEDGVGIHGMTASSVASVSLDPPLALVSIGHERNTHPLIVRNGRFGISLLEWSQRTVARHYTVPEAIRRTLPPPEFEPLGESMVVADALTAMDCRVVQSVEAGDHTVFIAEVEEVTVYEGDPLLYFQRKFARLED